MIHVLLLAGAAIAIYAACEWFINAVEWLGARLHVGKIAVGTLLAAIGTAMPESVVTFVAVAFGGGNHSKDIGVGAAMGGPLALSTIAYAVVGLVLLANRRRRRRWSEESSMPSPEPPAGGSGAPGGGPAETPTGAVSGRPAGSPSGVPVELPTRGPAEPPPEADLQSRRLARDQTWFLCVFVVKVGLGLVAFAIKPWLGVLFFATYVVYFSRELGNREGAGETEGLAPLKLQPGRATPSTAAVVIQTIATLAVIFGASQVFVHQLEWAGPALGLSATVTALLLSPVATELPEVLNACLWVRQGKTDLALANISGAMMIQATVPSGLGILFTPWKFDAPLIASGAVTIAAIVYLMTTIRAGRLTAGRLAVSAAFYAAFIILLMVT